MSVANPKHWPDWLDEHIWPQIQTMICNDASFKLMGEARQLTGEFNGPIAKLIEIGYLTSQMLTIRRLCDDGRTVISLRRVLIEAKASSDFPNDQINQLSCKLDSCGHVCELVNNYVAHIANPLRRPNVKEWNLQAGHLTEAQRAICEVAVTLDRDLFQRKNPVKIIPVPQFKIMEEFEHWVPDADIKKLWEFWHPHNNVVNAWILPAPGDLMLEFKRVLGNPDWQRDPVGKARAEAYKVVDELMTQRRNGT